MSKFLKIPPLLIGVSGSWLLGGVLSYRSQRFSITINVPDGFETDLASIPRLARLLIPVNGNHRAAAILHDYLYFLRGRLLNPRVTLTSKHADQLFLEAMTISGVAAWKCRLMYTAVRAGGWAFWRA